MQALLFTRMLPACIARLCSEKPNAKKKTAQARVPVPLVTMFNWIRELPRTRYVASLEGEVVRLRAENRALMNSLLGTAGFPPVEFPAAAQSRELPRTRRRSWHQIQAWREASATRAKENRSDSQLS